MALLARNTVQIKQSLALQTRCANNVVNEFNPLAPDAAQQRAVDDLKRDYPQSTARTHTPTFTYNCHGLTFAARRTQIWSSEEIGHILKDDGYQPMANGDVLAGDIVLYQSQETGEIEHSGVVVEKGTFLNNHLVLSKWGVGHEVLHRVSDCPYVPSTITYHRIIG